MNDKTIIVSLAASAYSVFAAYLGATVGEALIVFWLIMIYWEVS